MVEIPATSKDDAQARIHKVPMSRYVGELVMKIPTGGGFFARWMCRIRNFVR